LLHRYQFRPAVNPGNTPRSIGPSFRLTKEKRAATSHAQPPVAVLADLGEGAGDHDAGIDKAAGVARRSAVPPRRFLPTDTFGRSRTRE
jgi:hypothetical protein